MLKSSRGGVRSQRSCLAFYVPGYSCVPRVPLQVKTESRDFTGIYDFEGRICDEAAPPPWIHTRTIRLFLKMQS